MTVGFHISSDVATIDLDSDAVSDEDCRDIEAMVNEHILLGLPVSSLLVSREEFSAMGIRSRGVPDWVEGPIRLIQIEGVDLNNCGGTHVKNTSELMMFAIVRKEKLKKKTRLHFVYGNRLLQRFQNYVRKEKSLNEIFQDGAHLKRAREWAIERKRHKKERKKWFEEKSKAEGERLARTNKDWNVVYKEDWDLGMIQNMLRVIAALNAQASFLVYSQSVFAGVIHDAEQYQSTLQYIRVKGGKGGGRTPMFQGKWSAQIDPKVLFSELAAKHD